MGTAKPIYISKQIVLEAYRRVKANKGAAGIDKESMEKFEKEAKKSNKPVDIQSRVGRIERSILS